MAIKNRITEMLGVRYPIVQEIIAETMAEFEQTVAEIAQRYGVRIPA